VNLGGLAEHISRVFPIKRCQARQLPQKPDVAGLLTLTGVASPHVRRANTNQPAQRKARVSNTLPNNNSETDVKNFPLTAQQVFNKRKH
jgi:hypothetical protein